ncbi:molecular chaperone DnaJ [Vibrio sp. vnigr-6D03]|uniref:Molecular chaperone DnaJ n=1 Tax=Vibrio penaeicida TaxID=104609 RepID=A0AAV5NLX2_9VIBR|nr:MULTISPECIES: DNA-J related domain-containing protein [Vibrio]PKF77009.1 molecular chaperone DnaJ [Vibrio sp. vnigr-6D03]RTZ20819.1 molecular chaperone DnaJ [Vibrio penaeicida]GLQ71264.1 molecular chaperone DnaJ [Vibrio penaeicida]
MSNNDLIHSHDPHMENPLVWPIMEVLKKKHEGWKVHTLASHLSELGIIPFLDSSPEKDLFKRNFLMMNALYQLQETLYPDAWVQVQAMDIQLKNDTQTREYEIDVEDPLRDYYTDWSNYEAENGEVKRLLNEFWTRYRNFVGSHSGDMTRQKALRLFELDDTSTQTEIRKQWRRMALKWHPDREGGNTEKFRTLCEAWHLLRD